MKRLIGVIVGLVAALGLGTSSASATVYPPSGPTVTVSNGSPLPGSHITITASGFCDGDTIYFSIDPSGQLLGTVVADSSGNASLTIEVPDDPGTYVITALGRQCDDKATTTITVRRIPIPKTGSDSSSSLMIGGIAILTGAGLVTIAAVRRRRPTAA